MGYSQMAKEDEKDWLDIIVVHAHSNVKGGMKYNTGTLLMALER
ncbi:hypothetical protein ACHAWF_012863 [Thalassiosira exigua]